MATSLRDLLIIMMVMWIPASVMLFVRHSNQMQADMQQDLLKTIREEQTKAARLAQATNAAAGGAPVSNLRGLDVPVPQPQPAVPVVNDGTATGWPASPVFDPTGHAVTLDDLEPAMQESYKTGHWLAACNRIVEMNKPLLDAATLPTNVTLVSGIWDLGRDRIAVKSGFDFTRPFTLYTDAMKAFLKYKFPKVLYLEPDQFEQLKPAIEASTGGPVHVIFTSKEELRKQFKDFELVQTIRNKQEWKNQADWLAASPQSSLEYYNPLVMSKLRMTRDVARFNPFHTSAFLWIDGKHNCNDPRRINQEKEPYMLTFLDKLLITFFDYTPYTEVHGFSHAPFDEYLGVSATDGRPVKVGRGGVFGGTRAYLEVTTAIFEAMRTETLSRGYMGTEENLFSMLDYRFPQLIHHYDNGEGGNCAVFDDWGKHRDFKLTGYDLRGLTCYHTSAANAVRCFDNDVACPDFVNPQFLTVADRQGVCQDDPDYYCTVQCVPGTSEVRWQGHPCDPSHCPGKRVEDSELTPEKGRAYEESRRKTNEVPAVAPEQPQQPQPPAPAAPMVPAAVGPSGGMTGRQALVLVTDPADREIIEKYGFDTRGISCEVLNGVEQCFHEDEFTRESCPPHVNSAFLTMAKGQWACGPFNAPGTYCSATCQLGVERVSWTAHEIKWCESNKGSCPPGPKIIPVDEYVIAPYTRPLRKGMTCERPATGMPKVSILMLSRKETETLANTLATFDKAGLFEVADEVLVYLNERHPETEALLDKYKQPPYKLRVLGDTENHGITWPINWLVGNASNEHVLFLEKDFQLVESLDCVMDQLTTGKALLDSGTVHVVRFRSRHFAGKPNWAQITYKGNEDAIFKRQPNLLCNAFHWITSPEKRWPEHFWGCNNGPVDGSAPDNKVFYCSKPEFCNWTNNPFMITKTWWKNEYESKFSQFKGSDPYSNLESYMNWEKDAWNTRPWVIAQGEGLFKHADANNFGGGHG